MISDSEIERLRIREGLLAKLMAQISIYSGKKDGGLANLQDMVHKLTKGEAIHCERCERDVFAEGHTEGCIIVSEYEKIFT